MLDEISSLSLDETLGVAGSVTNWRCISRRGCCWWWRATESSCCTINKKWASNECNGGGFEEA